MNIYEIEEYAKDNGFDSVKFKMTNIFGKEFEGEFLDAYFGMIRIPTLGDGFIMLRELRKQYGTDFFTFEAIQ